MDATIIGRSLYVVYEVTKFSRLDLVAELTKDALRPIQLPRDYAGMSFIDNGTLVQGIRPLGGVDWFELRGTQAIPVARTRPQPDSNTLYTLTDGNRCEDGAPGSGVAILEVDGHGRARPLITSAALKAATGGILDAGYAVSCRHFDGEDFATLNTGLTIIFRIANGHATPFATGEIMASNDDVLLLRNNDYVLLEARVIH